MIGSCKAERINDWLKFKYSSVARACEYTFGHKTPPFQAGKARNQIAAIAL
ncbi:hypothetical protein DPMN_180028 [Dreissena polymorpha]|uniref:Uncharacterized protein n=1 Tax=Dreissena polymorpha TaxID=45954 RepID=A0A9D4EF40_DREPO|nr:hypothetical protein DPMN_180028 [Dreissena polymorpha]